MNYINMYRERLNITKNLILFFLNFTGSSRPSQLLIASVKYKNANKINRGVFFIFFVGFIF